MEEKNTSFKLRSEEVQDILTKVPHWMIRWGTVVIFNIIIVLFFLSWFMKYPDVVASEIVITTNIPPEKLIAKTSGRIVAILVKDKSLVKKNTYLAIIENSANYKDVLYLKNLVDKTDINNSKNIFPFIKLQNLQLGEIETAFANFQKDYIADGLNTNLQPFQIQNNAQKSELQQIKERLSLLLQQKEINEQELKLQKKEISRYTILNNKGIVSDQEFENKKLNYLQAEKNYNILLSTISQLKSSLIENLKNTQEVKINETKETIILNRNIKQSFYQLKKAIKDWELNYTLKSSIDGKVTFLQVWSKNQVISSNENVFSIIPKTQNGFIGKLKAPALNSGKLKIGQQVNIRLANFPDKEFGIIKGKIKNISLLPDRDGNILIDVILPKGLQTSFKKEITFQQEMKGSADIITNDLRLLERILYLLKPI